jgi:hypothetical protein
MISLFSFFRNWSLPRKLFFVLGAGLFVASFLEQTDDTLIVLGAILMAQTLLDRGCISCNSGSCERFSGHIQEPEED